MAGCKSMLSNYDGEEHVIAAARHIVKALGQTKNLSDDLRKILADLDCHLSSRSIITEDSGGTGLTQIERRLKHSEKNILNWEIDSSVRDLSEYLEVVDETQALFESLRGSSLKGNRKQKELFGLADKILHMAMSSLAREVINIIVQHTQLPEPECISFRCNGDAVALENSFVSVDQESVEENSTGNDSEVPIRDLVDPKFIPDLKSIANAMFASDYGIEFCQAFSCVSREALEEYMAILELENLSIEDVMKLDWESLNDNIRKWVRAMKIIVRVYLSSEKQLCEKILGDFGTVSRQCFVEISKPSMLRLFNFGEAVAMGVLKPEKLIRLLDMYEVMTELLPNVDKLFSEDVGFWVRSEYKKLLSSIGDTAKATFVEFRKAIACNESLCPFPKGGIHHLTRYVMNYIKILTEYADTLKLLLEDPNGEKKEIGWHLRSITSTLESNLENKAELYKNEPLQHIFMMNNVHYMVHKVMGSELRIIFEDEWIRKNVAKYQQLARNYGRTTWTSVLLLLRDDLKSIKERLRTFAVAFDEVYKLQTGWSVANPELRDDLRIANSLTLIPAYRSFLGHYANNILDVHLKYNVCDLENLLLHFFEELPRTLRNSRRR
ncbi:hypothetical protein ACFE04_006762 [Oxalis oulophora]